MVELDFNLFMVKIDDEHKGENPTVVIPQNSGQKGTVSGMQSPMAFGPAMH